MIQILYLILDRSYWNSLLRDCFIGCDKKTYSHIETPTVPPQSHSSTLFYDAINASFSCTGLLIAYLVWGLLQERIMTQVQ